MKKINFFMPPHKFANIAFFHDAGLRPTIPRKIEIKDDTKLWIDLSRPSHLICLEVVQKVTRKIYRLIENEKT